MPPRRRSRVGFWLVLLLVIPVTVGATLGVREIYIKEYLRDHRLREVYQAMGTPPDWILSDGGGRATSGVLDATFSYLAIPGRTGDPATILHEWFDGIAEQAPKKELIAAAFPLETTFALEVRGHVAEFTCRMNKTAATPTYELVLRLTRPDP